MSSIGAALDHIDSVSATVADADSAGQLAAAAATTVRAMMGNETSEGWQDLLGRFDLLRDERLRLPAENRFFAALDSLLRQAP